MAPTPPETIVPANAVPGWDAEVDVLVVGLGAAGVCAALEAARAGARTLVAEKASFGGGTSAMSGGVLYLGGGTALQRACGFDDTPEAMRRYLMASCGPAPHAGKIDLYSTRSAAHFDWLVAQGIPFKAEFWPEYAEPHTDAGLYFSGCEHTQPYAELAMAAPRGHVVQAEGSVADPSTVGGGRILMDALEARAREAGVASLFGADLVALVRSPDGSIDGAGFAHEGRRHWVRARGGVILTTGGFIANRPMLERHARQGLELLPLAGAHDEGDGIRLGEAAGAATTNMDALAYMCPVLEPHALVQGILFDARGQRFVTEDANHKRIAERCLSIAEGRMYLLVDDAIFCQPRFEKELVASGETLAEVVKELPFLPPGALEATVHDYNAHATRGRDPVLGKRSEHLRPLDRPPFGVFDCSLGGQQPYMAMTLGGLDTRPSGEVCSPSGAPIEGLYAAGRATSCLSAQNCFASGIQLGEGTFFGRLAGAAAAARSHSPPHGQETP